MSQISKVISTLLVVGFMILLALLNLNASYTQVTLNDNEKYINGNYLILTIQIKARYILAILLITPQILRRKGINPIILLAMTLFQW